ncbi:hypothetical protein F2Q68_00022087 [Brassica cretica]|uniref:RNase H type-1 domain-containing protein n=1 Tax=Brassica cretica TaxID=69181 RepID=A0A8S9G2W7_BRACR|nr:hypothetical protein F2Q68_00022087 [Brassica cretica]
MERMLQHWSCQSFGTDCKDLTEMVKEPQAWPSFSTELETIKTLHICFPDFKISHIPRAHNGILDSLAKIARLFQRELCYIGYFISLGMASALETLCGQAYGAKQYHMLGIYLQRSWLVLIGSTICLTPIYIFAGPILLALGQEERLVRIARVIALWVIGINFSFVPSFTCQMFLQAQSKNKIIAYVAAISLGVHVFLSWLLMVHFDFGIAGAITTRKQQGF